MPRRPGRADEILDAFTRSVADLGYDGTNFSALAEELGVSKGTLVHHFGAKERMLAAVHESYMRRRLEELGYILEHLTPPAEQLASLLHAFLRYQVDDRAATLAVHREIVRLADREAMAAGRAMRVEYLRLAHRIVATGVSDGSFRPVDPGLDTLLVFGSAQWMWTWFDPAGARSSDEVGQALVDLVLGSLLADRTGLDALSDPTGAPAQVARDAIAAAS